MNNQTNKLVLFSTGCLGKAKIIQLTMDQANEILGRLRMESVNQPQVNTLFRKLEKQSNSDTKRKHASAGAVHSSWRIRSENS